MFKDLACESVGGLGGIPDERSGVEDVAMTTAYGHQAVPQCIKSMDPVSIPRFTISDQFLSKLMVKIHGVWDV